MRARVHDLFFLLLVLIAVIARCYMLHVVAVALLWKFIDFMLFAFIVVGVVARLWRGVCECIH